MSDYKNTLNLPQTDFPMKANLAQREPAMLERWQSLNLYETLRNERKDQPKFVLLDGPPYANGHLHVGHAVNKVLKDIIVKSKTMSGYDAPFVPGWDCHGLPIELNVEKKHGKPGQKISTSEFRKACRDYALSQFEIQRDEFKRLGVLGDWDHPYLTMSYDYEAAIVRSLAKVINNGHLQKGYKPVHWCLDCGSALAEAEVEYADKTSPSIDVKFEVIDPVNFWQRFEKVASAKGPVVIPIWTTTPWTLPANEAVALNPQLQYALIAISDMQLLIATDLLPSVLTRYGIQEYKLLGHAMGEQLSGIMLQHPLYDKHVPVIMGEHVTIEAGTGAVHTAPAHGVDDYLMGQKYQLAMQNPVGDDGCYVASTPLFAGLHVNRANEKILEILETRGALLHKEKLQHSYPHCWRHKTPLIFRATPQWFISMDQNGLRKEADQAIERVSWIPDWGQSRIKSMIENRPDWCISRQRTWGVPLCLITDKETGELHPDMVFLMEKIASRIEKEGIEAWYNLELNALLSEKEATQYKKTMDILDVWFDSGVAHEAVLKQRQDLNFPCDIVLEGSDQHRGWFQSSLLTSVAINGSESYKAVLTHGFVVDGQGRKMSKSLGNVIALEDGIRTMGADILRLWIASVDYRYEINASKELLSRMSESYRRIRNTIRFLLSNLTGFDPATDLLQPEEMLWLDRFAIEKTRLIQQEIKEAYDTYQFHTVVQKLHQFCVTDLGSFYLDIIKDRQYTMPLNSGGRRSAQTAMYHLAHAMVRWMAPIMSFTADEVWQYLPGIQLDSVLLTTWYDELNALPEDSTMNVAYWEKIQAVRDAVNKEIENQRNAGKIGSALEAEVYLYCASPLKQQLDELGDELRFVLITSQAQVIAEEEGPVERTMTDIPELSLIIKPTAALKCERCWHRREDVNQSPDYPGLCGRCVINVAGVGEQRRYA